MALVRYIPEPGTPATATQFGVTFGPEPVSVSDPRILAKLKGSPFYALQSYDEEATKIELRAVHNGGGRYVVVKGDEDQKVMSGLTKADAEAFNALSDEDKASYVEGQPAE